MALGLRQERREREPGKYRMTAEIALHSFDFPKDTSVHLLHYDK